jgi:chloramphenicol 3-O-phosphotransferase
MKEQQFPFGAVASEELSDSEFGEVFLKSNHTIKNASEFTSLIVGRRGAGKSTALAIARTSKAYWLAIEIDALEIYGNLKRQIELHPDITFQRQTCARIWEKVILDYVAFGMHQKLTGADEPREKALGALLAPYANVVEGDGKKKITAFTMAYEIARRSVRLFAKAKLGEEAAGEVDAAFADLNRLWYNYENVREQIESFLATTRRRVVVCIDTLDDLTFADPAVELLVTGQVHALNAFKNSACRIDVKCALPEEQYSLLQERAIIVDKDFSSVSLVLWRRDDLIGVVGKRGAAFLKRHRTVEPTDHVIEILKAVEENRFSDAFTRIFPAHVKNYFGKTEDTSDFLIRNTYHLPRQLINICNSAMNLELASTRDAQLELPLSEAAVLSGVAENQSIVCNSVLGAYKESMGGLHTVMSRLLSLLMRRFPLQEFKQAVQVLIDGKIIRDERFMDAERVLDLMLGIGILGIHVPVDKVGLSDAERQEKEPIYNFAEFRYLSIWKPSFTRTSEFCVHPCFSGCFVVAQSNDDKGTYPIGRQKMLYSG